MSPSELKEILIEAEYSREEIDNLTLFEMFEAWLNYEGIIGYSEEIWDTVKELIVLNE